jgi:hypothetical protein
MDNILVTNKNTLYMDDGIILSKDSKKSIKLKFLFQKRNKDLTYVAVFRNELSKRYFSELDDDNCCYVPEEVLRKTDSVFLKIVGIKDYYKYIYVGEGQSSCEHNEATFEDIDKMFENLDS